MKKNFSLFITIILCLSMVACSGSSGKVDEALLGKYICVTGTMLGMTMSGDDMSDFELELQDKGKATMKISGESHNVKWSSDDSTITLKIDGVDAVGELGENTITFKDFLEEQLGTSMDLTFAKDGTEAAEPENYLPKEEKSLIGDWVSVSVADVLGDDVSEEVDPTALAATFDGDHSATISFMGKEIGSSKWSLLTGILFFDDKFDDGVVIDGKYSDEEFTLTYINESTDAYYIFTMSNSGNAAATGKKDEAKKDKSKDESVGTPDVPEPKASGDGMATKDNVLRLIKYRDQYYDTKDMAPTYEEMVAVVGIEGKDLGNKGPNNMTEYGDHIIRWYAGADNAYVDFTFRLEEGADAWRAVQWVSQNIDNADVEAVDISDLLSE